MATADKLADAILFANHEAILRERERCARIAERHADSCEPIWADAAREIAAEIRKG